jgi:WD40 repeat protein
VALCSGHDDDIVSLAIDPTCNFVATGQLGAKPRVHVWDSESGCRIVQLPLVHQRAVCALAFSSDGKMIASVGDDNNHSAAVYATASGSWTDGKVVGRGMGDTEKVRVTACDRVWWSVRRAVCCRSPRRAFLSGLRPAAVSTGMYSS